MRLYLSSFRLGNKPEEILALLRGRTKAAVIMNAGDASAPERRAISLEGEIAALRGLGLDPVELDLRHYFGKSEELKHVLREFDLLWVRGGNCFVLRRAFSQSGADDIIKAMPTISSKRCSFGTRLYTPAIVQRSIC